MLRKRFIYKRKKITINLLNLNINYGKNYKIEKAKKY